jgi:hypothetical protein
MPIMKSLKHLVYLIGISFLFSGCVKKSDNYTHVMEKNMNPEILSSLKECKIFFGHQSVGYNIVEGIGILNNESNDNNILVKETRIPSDIETGVFAHCLIGKNEYPKLKIDDFASLIRNGIGDSADIAFMKLCYVDFNKNTDITELFNYYREAMAGLQSEYPRLKIFHCTVPLNVKPSGLKGMAKKFLKMDRNIYINSYNNLLGDYYPDSSLFDIAALESFMPDGSINTYKSDIKALANEYSSDGGHLNREGSVMIASKLLIKLSKIDQL